MLYLLALESGLRWGELASLTRGSFNFEAHPPVVAVKACDTKNKKPDTVPLKPATATPDLADALAEPRAEKAVVGGEKKGPESGAAQCRIRERLGSGANCRKGLQRK